MTITKLYIVDWYDDIITSIISFENDELYLFNCIQRQFISGKKTYYCVKIDEESSKQIGNMIEKKIFTKKDYDILNLIFEKNNKNDNVFLLDTESLFVGSDIIFRKTKNSDLRSITFPFDISTLYTDQNNNERYI